MARILRIAQRMLYASSPTIRTPPHEVLCCVHSLNVISTSLHQNRPYGAPATANSPFESNILRILRNEMEYQSEYAPPEQPHTKFNSFTVQDRPGEQWITMKGRFGDKEEIKIEATMFDGYAQIPKLGDDSSGMNVRLHIGLLVDISKEECGSELEFVCSAWPESLEIQRVFILRRDQTQAMPYTGPDFSIWLTRTELSFYGIWELSSLLWENRRVSWATVQVTLIFPLSSKEPRRRSEALFDKHF